MNAHLSSDRRRSTLSEWHKMWGAINDSDWHPVNVSLIEATDADKRGSASRSA